MSQKRKKEPSQRSGSIMFLVALAILGALAIVAVTRKPKSETKTSPSVSDRPTSAVQVATAPNPALGTNLPALPKTEEQATDLDKATEHVQAGNKLLAQNKVPQAVEEYRQAIKLNPEDEDTHYNLAFALAKTGQGEEAKKEYEEALRIYPDYVEAHNNLANLLVRQGRFDDAILHFNKAIELDPKNASAENNLGNALARTGKIPDAVVHFQAALNLDAKYNEARNNLASAYLILGQVENAISEFSSILQANPNFQPAKQGLNRALEAKAKKQ